MPKRGEANRKTNIWVARCVPLLIFGLIGYVSWVVTKLICADFLLKPRDPTVFTRRPPSAIAILVTYYLLLVITIVTYARLLDVVARSPGLVPRGSQWYSENVKKSHSRRHRNRSSSNTSDTEGEKVHEPESSREREPIEVRQLMATERLDYNVEEFWKRDVFICNPDGRPPYCSTCHNWKPDRTHHCSELDRCVLKFDHFCPWVGGVIGERSFKFFVQFTFYAALYTLEVLVVTAYYFAERRRHSGFSNGSWIATMALAGLFFLFSGGMCLSSAQFVLINSTTVENLSRKTKVWCLAVYASPELLEEASEKSVPLRLITYPRPPEEQLGAGISQQQVWPSTDRVAEVQRTFVLLDSQPGANPFDLGPRANFQDIMGYTLWDWVLPIKPSPCIHHEGVRSFYKTGSVLSDMKAEVGLKTWLSEEKSNYGQGRRRRRRGSGRHHSTVAQGDRGT